MRLSAPIFKLKRKAKQLSREDGIPLHRTLDRLAAGEGFRSWSHLSALHPSPRPPHALMRQLGAGDILLLGARPGHGKTLLGLELMVLAMAAGRTGLFFTLEYAEQDVLDRLVAIGFDPAGTDARPTIVTSDDICADLIIERAEPLGGTAFVVVDYLQLLDQKRFNPSLPVQLARLRDYAKRTGATVVVISQVDRRFEAGEGNIPTLADLRMPNAFDPAIFDRACFVHNGEVRIDAAS